MRHPLKVPEFGAGSEPVRLCGWLVGQGDYVLSGDVVAEILIPGITLDVAADAAGWLVEIAKPVDALLHQGDTLGWLEVGSPTDPANP